jgi:hypothetical protein
MTSTAHAERGCPSGKVHGHACAYRTGAQHTAHVGIARELSDPKKASPRRGRAAATESRERPSETRDGRRDPTRAERTTAQASRPGRRCSARDVELPCSFRCARHPLVRKCGAARRRPPRRHARRPRLYAQATLSRGVAKRARRVRVRVRRRLPSGGAAVDCPVMGRRSDSHDRCCAR